MKQLSLLILSLLVIGCGNRTKEEAPTEVPKTNLLVKANLRKDALQVSLDFPKLQWFFMDTSELIIQINVEVPELVDIQKFGKPVILLDSSHIRADSIKYYMVIKDFKINNDTALVTLHYPAQGARADLILIREGDIWKVKKSGIYEN